MSSSARYFLQLGEREWTVDVCGSRVRSGGEDVEVRPGAFPGEVEVRSGNGSWLRLLAQPAGGPGRVAALWGGRYVVARVESERDRLRSRGAGVRAAPRPSVLRSVIPGVIRRVLKAPGERVEEGEAVLTLEAMKMENEVRSEVPGRLARLEVREGQVVAAGEELAVVEPE